MLSSSSMPPHLPPHSCPATQIASLPPFDTPYQSSSLVLQLHNVIYCPCAYNNPHNPIIHTFKSTFGPEQYKVLSTHIPTRLAHTTCRLLCVVLPPATTPPDPLPLINHAITTSFTMLLSLACSRHNTREFGKIAYRFVPLFFFPLTTSVGLVLS